ncbi:MAG: CPBP family intramembrane metalloprotease, partial [Oscillospiraceae bacterium]|nr:CPBP family intramembrane metalloprotease [Oscillospiraceae bacterium]
MITFIPIAGRIQGALGMPGVAITELIILFVAILAPIILKQDLRLVFPIRVPKLREILGTILIWIGTFFVVMIFQIALMYFFQEGMMNVVNDLSKVISSVPFIVAFIIVSIMPAICEEALHRGFILANFKPVKNKFIIVVCMGIIFGVFHTDIYRFLPTAILGGALSYVMLETDNMILPMLFHFINNLSSSFANFSSNSVDVNTILSKEAILLVLGSFLTFGFFIPVLLYIGSRLLKASEEKRKIKGKHLIGVFGLGLILFILGTFIVGYLYVNDPNILNTLSK